MPPSPEENKAVETSVAIGSVEQAGALAIGQLVVGGESTIAEERLAWHPLSVGYDSGNASQAKAAAAKPDADKGTARSGAQLSRVYPEPAAGGA
jgi:hypothetical protein